MAIKSWENVKELLHQAMELAPEERPHFLDEACSSDHSLRAELESLMKASAPVFCNRPRPMDWTLSTRVSYSRGNSSRKISS
jgi:hypothetical protein